MIETANIKNGVNVDQLVETIGAVQGNPELAKFEFRSKNNWIEGGHCISSIKSFYGVGAEDTSREKAFTMECDHPQVLLGNDKAATPPEVVLHALGSCLTGAMVYHAAANGIEIAGAESSLEGGVDLHGFLGLDAEVRKGFDGIKVRIKVKSDASVEQLENLAKFSPVFDMITNPTPISIEIVK
ncbi:OsmC family protein [Arenibacter sp. M-2]|uniref:OsmC family protein n=1 Tax=unclassified Arenibacter TaxID=2615047 RepID=UPI000D774555|nr:MULTISPECIES: OsmC family protein [unclassified Arenibacter]MDL5512677.1 OsmC family protein [Arenibacter sp. M-2]PXX28332.1 putative OsmC-like protein [Arenibacter sp. ARW7G5Y1]|tara:strand:+ start:28131 stop:28682 length:552 start_codon:yes stop_codon:yes gene_type:complete